MKAIKVNTTPDDKSDAAINAVLAAVNGKATAHTYTHASEIRQVVAEAEKQLHGLLGNNRLAPGATYKSASGDSVPKAYKYSRQGTEVILERRSTGWFLVDVRPSQLYERGGWTILELTPAQDEVAVARLRKQYQVKAEVQS